MRVADTFKLDLVTINKIVSDATEPMSIVQIKARFGLVFPFKVKRVRFSKESAAKRNAFSGVTIVTEISYGEPRLGGPGYRTNNRHEADGEYYRQSADLEDYILWEVP